MLFRYKLFIQWFSKFWDKTIFWSYPYCSQFMSDVLVFDSVSAKINHSSSPLFNTSRNFPPHESAKSPSKSPPTPRKSYPEFQNPRTTFENNPLCPPKYSIVRGVGRVPDFFLVGILIFLLLRSPCKISKPYENPFWEKSNPRRFPEERGYILD